MQDEDMVVPDPDASGDRTCADTVARGRLQCRRVNPVALDGWRDDPAALQMALLALLRLGPADRAHTAAT
jgi:hypothetical protein